MMRYGAEYAKRSEAEYAAQHRTRLERNLKRRARELGYELVKPDGEVLAAALPADSAAGKLAPIFAHFLPDFSRSRLPFSRLREAKTLSAGDSLPRPSLRSEP